MGRFAVERNSENHAPTTPVPTGAAFDLAPNFGPSPVAPWRSIRTTGRMTIDAHPWRWSSARFEDCRRSMGNLITSPIMSLLVAQQEPMRPSKAQGNQFACVLVHTESRRWYHAQPDRRDFSRCRGWQKPPEFLCDEPNEHLRDSAARRSMSAFICS